MSGVLFRLGSVDYMLVDRGDIWDTLSEEQARQIVDSSPDVSPQEADAIARGLADGSLVAVQLDAPRRTLDAPVVRPLIEPTDPVGPAPAQPTRLDIEVVHETGGWFPGARFTVELPDRRLVDGVLDDRSRFVHEGVRDGRDCTITFHDPLALSDDEQRRPSTPTVEARDDDLNAPVATAPELSVIAGRPRRLVVLLPPKVPLFELGAGVFTEDAAFVSPAILPSVDALTAALREKPRSKVSVLANADREVDPQTDKDLADARAKALLAVLLGDDAAFDELADQEQWSLLHYQVMLRALGCNPAAIDDIDGPLTQHAVRTFQGEWSRGLFHPDGLGAPVQETGTLDDDTKTALRRAYLLTISPQLSGEELASPPRAGCGSFALTPAGGGGHVSGGLAVWPRDDRRQVPCTEADPNACIVDGRGEHDQCRFFRETFAGAQVGVEPTFFDFDWLRFESGAFNLSAITSLPDGTSVRFHVFRDVSDYDGRVRLHHGAEPLPQRGTLVATVDGIVRMGICVAQWRPPPGWDPLDWIQWFAELQPDDEPTPSADAPAFAPPLFAIEYDGGWAFSRPPGERIDRFALRNTEQPGVALSSDGQLVEFSVGANDYITTARERRADEHVLILGWCSFNQHLVEEGESA